MAPRQSAKEVLVALNMDYRMGFGVDIINELAQISEESPLLARLAFEVFIHRLDKESPPLATIQNIGRTGIAVSSALDIARTGRPKTIVTAALWIRKNNPIMLESAREFAGIALGPRKTAPYLSHDKEQIWIEEEFFKLLVPAMPVTLDMRGDFSPQFKEESLALL